MVLVAIFIAGAKFNGAVQNAFSGGKLPNLSLDVAHRVEADFAFKNNLQREHMVFAVERLG